MREVLELMNVSAGYGGGDVICGVSLNFMPGRIYAVVGKNGCGKSTLLKCCSGVIKPSCGSILLQKRETGQYAPRERAQLISYFSQTRNAPGISAERLVEHGCYPRLGQPRRLSRSDRENAVRAMELMDVAHLKQKSVKELSGGECQRVFLAMQLAQNSRIMLLDEPTTYMDIEYQLRTMELLRRLRDEGKTIIMVLHDLQQALRYADEMIVMEAGRIVSAASPEKIFADRVLEQIFNIRIRKLAEGFLFETTNHPI